MATVKPYLSAEDMDRVRAWIKDLKHPVSKMLPHCLDCGKEDMMRQKEIDGLDALLAEGYIDSFRLKHPEEVKYSWWNYKFNARARNVGWRIDYFVVSKALENQIEDSLIYNEYLGSDHCPVGLKIDI